MNPTIINNKFTANWLTPSDHFLVDRPVANMLHGSLFSSLDNFGFLNNNFQETPDGYKVEVAVPGMCKKDLHLTVDNHLLIVQVQQEQKEKAGWFKKAPTYRSTQLYKTLVLPEDADVNGIRAECKNGLLTISIPKINQANKRKLIPVSVEAEPKEDWWEKLTRPLTLLWDKVSGKSKNLAHGF